MSIKLDEEKKDFLLDENEWDSLLEDDDEFDAAVKEEYIREAEEIEKALFPEGLPRISASEAETRASYEKLVELMKKKGIYHEDAPSGSTAVSGGSVNRNTMAFARDDLAIAADGNSAVLLRMSNASGESVCRHTFFRHFRKGHAAGVVAACLAGVFLVSMTSEANRAYFVRTVKYLTGNGSYVVINNDSENEKARRDEAAAREKIEDMIGVAVPEIKYRPDSFEFYDYDVYKDAAIAMMEYMYNGNIIELYISGGSDSSISRDLGLHGDQQTTFSIEDEKMEVTATEIIDSDEEIPAYYAQWERNKAFYQISGRIEKEEFEKIIKSMVY